MDLTKFSSWFSYQSFYNKVISAVTVGTLLKREINAWALFYNIGHGPFVQADSHKKCCERKRATYFANYSRLLSNKFSEKTWHNNFLISDLSTNIPLNLFWEATKRVPDVCRPPNAYLRNFSITNALSSKIYWFWQLSNADVGSNVDATDKQFDQFFVDFSRDCSPLCIDVADISYFNVGCLFVCSVCIKMRSHCCRVMLCLARLCDARIDENILTETKLPSFTNMAKLFQGYARFDTRLELNKTITHFNCTYTFRILQYCFSIFKWTWIFCLRCSLQTIERRTNWYSLHANLKSFPCDDDLLCSWSTCYVRIKKINHHKKNKINANF